MKVLIVVLSVTLLTPNQYEGVDYVKLGSQYMTEFHARSSPTRRAKAVALVPEIVEASLAMGVDPLLTLTIIQFESAGDPDAVGKKGEVGIMQVNSRLARGYDLSTVDGQVRAGCATLRHHWAKYGKTSRTPKERLLATLSAYQLRRPPRVPGVPIKSAVWRYRRYARAVQDLVGINLEPPADSPRAR